MSESERFFMSKNSTVTFTEGKIPREELHLITLSFAAPDYWIPTLGPNTFCLWLQFISFCDRSDADRKLDKIPSGIAALAKRLGMSENTLRSHIRKMWNYGLIDLEEYEQSKQKGTKPINIIVYKAPQNRADLMTKPLQKVRDYKKDYNSQAKKYGEMNNKKEVKKEVKKEAEQAPEQDFLTLQKNEGGSLQKNEGGSLQKIEGNNILNPINKSIKNINNKNLSISKFNFDPETEQLLLKNEDRLTDYLLKRIEKIYKVYSVDLNRFHEKLQAALLKGRNVASYLEAALVNPDREKPAAAAPGKATRTEQLPAFMTEQQPDQEAAASQDAEFLKQKEELEAKLAAKYKKKQA